MRYLIVYKSANTARRCYYEAWSRQFDLFERRDDKFPFNLFGLETLERHSRCTRLSLYEITWQLLLSGSPDHVRGDIDVALRIIPVTSRKKRVSMRWKLPSKIFFFFFFFLSFRMNYNLFLFLDRVRTF